MGAQEFGEYFRRETKDKGMSASTVGGKIGPWPPASENYLNDTGVRRIYEGGRRLTHDFVQHLIDTFGLDPAEAWSAAGLWPPDLTADDYRAVKGHRSARRSRNVVALGSEVDLNARRRAQPSRNLADQATTQDNQGSCGSRRSS